MNRPMASLMLGMLLLLTAGMARAQVQEAAAAVPVKGDGLASRIEAAKKQWRGEGGGRRGEFFFSAYSFDIRSGVAVDSVPGISGGIVTGNVGEYETRHAGILLRHEAGAGTIVRIEIYDLDRRRDNNDIYPVHWLGHASNDESLNLLGSLAGSKGKGEVATQAVVAVALHNDDGGGRVEQMLRDFVHKALPEDVRTTAIAWLGRMPGQQLPFLSELARDEHESLAVREQAVVAIARSRDASALATLQNLYAAVNSRDVKEQIIRSAAKTGSKELAADFLVSVAETDADYGLREQALATLRKKLGRQRADGAGSKAVF